MRKPQAMPPLLRKPRLRRFTNGNDRFAILRGGLRFAHPPYTPRPRRAPQNSTRSDSSSALPQQSPWLVLPACRQAPRVPRMSFAALGIGGSPAVSWDRIWTESGRRRMKIQLGTLFVTSAVLIGPAVAQDAAGLLQAADKATGASAVKSVAYSGTGTIRYPGQNFEPNGDWPRAPMTSYNATIDYGSKSSKEEYAVDVAKKERGGGLAVPRATNFVSGNYAWNLNPQGQPNPQPAAAELRDFMITISPYGFVKAALASGNATVEDRYFNRLDQTVKVIGFKTGKYRVTGELDKDNLLARVVTWFPSPMMGDMPIEVRYTEWKDVGGGAKFPFHIHAHQGDHPLNTGGRNWFDIRVTDAKVNVPDAAVAVPDNVRNAP